MRWIHWLRSSRELPWERWTCIVKQDGGPFFGEASAACFLTWRFSSLLAMPSVGFFRVRNVGGDVVLADPRMGLEPNYVFQFKVAEMANPHALPLPNQRYETERGWEKLPWVWQRI